MNSSVLQGRMPNKRMEGDGDNAAYEFRSDSAAPHANRYALLLPLCYEKHRTHHSVSNFLL